MTANVALLDRQNAVPAFGAIQHDLSEEVSALLLRAATCVERDEANALDLIKRASHLLRPSISVPKRRGELAVGGLAPWQVKRLDVFIEQNISRTISIEQLSRLSNLSTSYFSAAFKTTYGTSPHNHVINCRVEYAKQLMLTSNKPLCEVALDCGLADQAHLSRIFRRVTGTTPSAWRRHFRQLAYEHSQFHAEPRLS